MGLNREWSLSALQLLRPTESIGVSRAPLDFVDRLPAIGGSSNCFLPGDGRGPAVAVRTGAEEHGEAAAAALAAVSPDPLRAIDWGTRLATRTVDVYFAPAGSYIDGVKDFGRAEGWSAFEKNQVFAALAQVSKVTNLTFRETVSQTGAEFRLGTFELDDYGAVAFGVPPGEPHSGFLGFDPDYLRWLDGDSGNPLLSRGGFMFAVLLEEFGHGLGLAHPHDDGGTSTILEGVTAPLGSYGVGGLNQGVYTVMGYNDGWPGGPSGSAYMTEEGGEYYIHVNDFGYEAGMMALDVAVLQRKYGANTTHASGADVYRLPDANRIGTFFQCIWDTSGVDTLRYDGARDATLDLRPATLLGAAGGGGYVSYARGIRGGFTIANGVAIEDAIGGSGNDNIVGSAGPNLLRGGTGDDRLNGGAGADRLQGGLGDDVCWVDNPRDTVTEGVGQGTDTIVSTISRALPDNVENLTLAGNAVINGVGNALGNTLRGNAADNRLNGGLGADAMVGGAGNDIYWIDNPRDTVTEAAGRGTDTIVSTISRALPDNVENLTLAGTAAINGVGNALGNTLRGNAADNRLNGGLGADAMVGGAGNDIYWIDNPRDTVTEAAGRGTDTIVSTISRALPDNVENLTLAGTAVINGVGNALDNTLRGNAADNRLNGGLGADAMAGGAGNDIYWIDNPRDAVTEAAGRGTDTIVSTISRALPDNVENLTLAGTAVINGVGNALDNTLRGNAADNRLNGGLGADAMVGGAGNDIYWIDNAGDAVTEAAGQGTDTIVSTITLSLQDNVENLSLAGIAAIDGFGNALANILRGNSAGNLLSGGEGDDRLNGGDGGDRLLGGAGGDLQNGGAGADVFVFLAVTDSSGTLAHDSISDFESAVDKIDLAAIDADPLIPGDETFTFIGSDAFSNAPAELRYAGGVIEGDTDGNGVADLKIEITNLAVLSESDFLL